MNDQVHSIFESSLRVTSAPVSSTRAASGRSKSPGRVKTPKMNGVFEIPITDRSDRTTHRTVPSKTPRPAWSKVPNSSKSIKSTKSKEPPKPVQKNTEDFSKTKTIIKSPRISVSQSFHIKNPELIDSIIATGNPSRSPSEKSTNSSKKSEKSNSPSSVRDYENEFERRDSSAAKIQAWWRNRQHRRASIVSTDSIQLEKASMVKDREKIREKIRKSGAKTAREQRKSSIQYELNRFSSPPKSSRPFDPKVDDELKASNLEPIKFSKRIQSSRRPKSYSNKIESTSESPRSISTGSPPNEKENIKMEISNAYQPLLYKETQEKDNLQSLLTALGELEKPKSSPKKIKVKESATDLKLAELEASLREIENSKKVKFKETNNISVLHKKGEENVKMMNLIFDEKVHQSEQMENQINILHSAIKQQKQEHERHLKEMEERFTQERKLIVDNNSTQNKRQLDFIDQLIKDKQSLAEQLTALAKKIETDEATKKKEIDELNSKHNVELTSIRDKLTAAEKLRREKWVEAKQKEIKELTVKGLEPEIARLIARHKQELRNIKAEHEAEIMAADERAARRWADQAERLRQAHEEEKIRIAEIERQRAKEKIEKELSQFESDSQIQRDRLNQERAIEKERQHQHVEYLKETNQNQITALQARHADNIKSLNEEWQLKFDDVIEKTSLEIKIEREKFEQKIEKNRLATEASNREKLIELENELRERVKIERDEEIERAVDRIEREMEKVRSQSEETSQNKIRRIQEKMQNEINLAEQNETEMQRKFSEARTKTNQVTEELIAEKHKSNLLAVELNEKEQRLHKLMTERERVSDVIREEFADRIIKAEKDLEVSRVTHAEAEARYKSECMELKRSREEELALLNDRVQKALKQRDDEIARINEAAEQAQRRADYMEEMLDKQNKLLREKKLKR